MNYLKNTTTGVDTPVQLFQKFLYESLKKIWPVSDSNFEGYGRVYRNANDKGYVPEVLVSSTEPNNTQYKPVFFDKTLLNALFFFTVDDLATFKEGAETVRLSVIFITNIALLKPSLAHRGDEEVRNDVQKLLDKNRQNIILTGYETGFKNVFKQFTGLTNKDGEIFEDRHPLFCFKFNMELFYQPTLVPCKK